MRHIVCRFLLVVATLGASAGATMRGQQPTDNRGWPPAVRAASADSPALSPEDERHTFHLPPGYRLELVASEPLVQDPIAMDWDPEGRLWVVEMPGYMPDITASTEHAPVGRIVVLQDVDGDGDMDRRTVFADGLVLARSVKVLAHGVLVAEPPDAWLMRDTDGDLRMDTKTRVTDQFGRREIDVQNNANGFDWSLDNRIRTAGQSRLHFQFKAGALVAAASPTAGQWGVTHDDTGRTYRNSNESALHVDLVAGEYFARHPGLIRTRGSYERLAMPGNDLNAVWPARQTPGLNRGYQAGILRDNGTLARYTAACSPVVYRGDRLPGDLHGNVFVADPAANLVSRLTLRDDGVTLRAAKAYRDGEFIASTDERFRPVSLTNGPDGTLYVIDMYRGLIEHRLSLTQYLKAYAERRGLVDPRGLGRIWRVVHETTVRDTTAVDTRESASLVALLAHPNGWRRDTAQRLLVERGDVEAAPALGRLAQVATDPRARLHALWTLDGIDAVTEAHVHAALADSSPVVRAGALRIAERWLDAPTPALRAAVIARTDDEHWTVRLQAAATLGALPTGDDKWAAMAALLARHGDDPVTVDVIMTGARGAEATLLQRVVIRGGDPGVSSPRVTAPSSTNRGMVDVVTILAATLFRSAREGDVQQWLARIGEAAGGPTDGPVIAARADAGDRLAEWQRDALMHGAEIGILGAPVPGQLPALPAAPGTTCPTCPGGRLSAGGQYAYAWPATATRTGSAGPPLRLQRAPAAFVALAAADSAIGKQATAVLTRISWPGKPGDAEAPTPLTRIEQQRFDEGGRVYEAMCQACHQADGRGQPGRAASLIGSPLALAAPDVPVRILLNGKEGGTGLMPSLGAAMSDAQVASVLTYVRREWGHGASAVDPSLVARQRTLTKGRTRPWTEAELIGR